MPVYTDKRNKRLYIEFQYKGRRYKERLPKTVTRADAVRLESKLKTDLMFASHGIDVSENIVFEDFILEFFEPEIGKYSNDSQIRITHVLKAAMPFFRGRAMREIKAADIEAFKRSRIALPTMHKRKRQPATVEREMSIISALFTLAVKNDVIDYNPCSRVRKLSFDNVQDKLLRRKDEQRLLDALPSKWVRDVVIMVLNTGLRQNDLMNLTRFEVDRDRRLITLIQGKTRRRVVIALNDTAFSIIESRWHNGTRYLFASPKTGKATGSTRHTLQRTCKKLGIESLSIRDLRRTFATRALEANNDPVTVAAALGHTGLRMIPRYVRSLELKRKLAESMENPANLEPTAKIDNVQVLKRKG